MSSYHDVAGGQAPHQGADTVLHLDACKAQLKGCLHIFPAVVDKDALAGLEVIFVQKCLINAGVRLVDVYFARSDAAIEEALQITNKQVADSLGGLPPVKIHCSILAEDAVKAAIEDYRKKQATK